MGRRRIGRQVKRSAKFEAVLAAWVEHAFGPRIWPAGGPHGKAVHRQSGHRGSSGIAIRDESARRHDEVAAARLAAYAEPRRMRAGARAGDASGPGAARIAGAACSGNGHAARAWRGEDGPEVE